MSESNHKNENRRVDSAKFAEKQLQELCINLAEADDENEVKHELEQLGLWRR